LNYRKGRYKNPQSLIRAQVARQIRMRGCLGMMATGSANQ
jgi:hypothetical protein